MESVFPSGETGVVSEEVVAVRGSDYERPAGSGFDESACHGRSVEISVFQSETDELLHVVDCLNGIDIEVGGYSRSRELMPERRQRKVGEGDFCNLLRLGGGAVVTKQPPVGVGCGRNKQRAVGREGNGSDGVRIGKSQSGRALSCGHIHRHHLAFGRVGVQDHPHLPLAKKRP